MDQEISKAVDFILNVFVKCNAFSEDICEWFKSILIREFSERFRRHWDPKSPSKGSAYRCVRINYDMDPFLLKVFRKSNFKSLFVDRLRNALPYEITVWIDPGEVAYRIGEDGSIGVLYNKVEEEKNSSKAKIVTCKHHHLWPDHVKRLNVANTQVYAS